MYAGFVYFPKKKVWVGRVMSCEIINAALHAGQHVQCMTLFPQGYIRYVAQHNIHMSSHTGEYMNMQLLS